MHWGLGDKSSMSFYHAYNSISSVSKWQWCWSICLKNVDTQKSKSKGAVDPKSLTITGLETYSNKRIKKKIKYSKT